MVVCEATTLAIVSREATLEMTRDLGEWLAEDLAEKKSGRVSSICLQVDPDRGRVTADIIGEVCEGRLMARVFQHFAQAIHDLKDDINRWIADNHLGECKTDLVRSEGRVFILVVGRVSE
jgi:hypothetical protein